MRRLDASAIREFDLRALPADFVEDPFPYYHALREHAPVYRCPDGSVLLTRHADVLAAYLDPRALSSDKRIEFRPRFGDSPLYEHHTTSLVFNDPPLHTRIRRAIVGSLGPRAINGMRAGLVELVDRLLDEIEHKVRFDAVTDFAALIPVEVIGNLLRVPHAERGPLRDWSLAILGALEPSVDADGLRRGNAAVIDFLDYLQGLVAERRQRPSQDRDDVLSRLILEADRGESGRNGETAEPLDNRVLLHNCIFILNAGHETTTNLIGNGIKLLLDIDGLATRLRAEPTLLPGAVEEMLRLQSPNQLGNRMVVRPVHVGGELLAPGTPVTLCIGAANRDPAVFAEPDRFLAERDPNPHLAFGHGPHLCAGLAVARMEARIALGRLLARFQVLRADGPPRLAGRVRFRGYRNLPLRVD